MIPQEKLFKFLTVFLYTAYANDLTFFLEDLASVKKLLNTFSCYSKFSDLYPAFSKCEIAGIGSLNGVEVAVCGIKCVNLKVNTIKIPQVHFSYNNKLNMEKNFLTAISNIQKVLKIWCMRNVTLDVHFKTLALSKIVYLCLTSVVPKQINEELENL